MFIKSITFERIIKTIIIISLMYTVENSIEAGRVDGILRIGKGAIHASVVLDVVVTCGTELAVRAVASRHYLYACHCSLIMCVASHLLA